MLDSPGNLFPDSLRLVTATFRPLNKLYFVLDKNAGTRIFT
jgi:hypothetical protein